MNNVIPRIQESADELKQLLAREHHAAKRQRLHALYLLASGQARFRGDVARLPGVDRNTVGRWLDQYAQGGLPALLTLYVPTAPQETSSSWRPAATTIIWASIPGSRLAVRHSPTVLPVSTMLPSAIRRALVWPTRCAVSRR
jgi:hypothetical protein